MMSTIENQNDVNATLRHCTSALPTLGLQRTVHTWRIHNDPSRETFLVEFKIFAFSADLANSIHDWPCTVRERPRAVVAGITEWIFFHHVQTVNPITLCPKNVFRTVLMASQFIGAILLFFFYITILLNLPTDRQINKCTK